MNQKTYSGFTGVIIHIDCKCLPVAPHHVKVSTYLQTISESFVSVDLIKQLVMILNLLQSIHLSANTKTS